jgi:hypothetical protein
LTDTVIDFAPVFQPDSSGSDSLHLPSPLPSMMQPPLPMKSFGLFLLFWLPWTWTGLGCIVDLRPPGEALLPEVGAFAGRQSECAPEFPDQNGWYGGDAGYSVALPIDEGRVSLWLFGDSFVERPEAPGGRVYPFVHNSIGLSHCQSGGRWSLETFWLQDEKGTPRAFFEPDPEADWVRLAVRETGALPYYWLFGGFVVHDVLFVGLLRVIHFEPSGPFNLSFKLLGMDLARIENYRDAPEDWRVQISTLSENPIAFPGSAFALTNSHLHAFAFIDRGDGRAPRMLGRLDIEALRDWRPDLSKALEYLAADSHWRSGFEPDDAKIIMDDDASEMSIHFDPDSKTWIAVYSDPTREDEAGPSEIVSMRRARNLEGPWSQPEALFTIPEMESDAAEERDENLICYAGKAHPQFASADQLVVTYVCNLFARHKAEGLEVAQRLLDSPNLYRLRAVSIAIPPNAEPALDPE